MLRMAALRTGLAPHVGRAVGFEERGAPSIRTEVPVPGIVLVLSLGPPMLVDGGWTGSFAAGQYLRPVVTGHGGEQTGLQLDLSPFAARALLGVPAEELTDRVVALEDLLPGVSLLSERVAAAPTWGRRGEIVEEALARRLADAQAPAPELQRAYGAIVASGGQVRVEALAREIGWSRRHLAARFRTEVGIGPKALARLVRFGRAVALLREGAPIADAAFATGYADQPHFNREFRALMGVSPGRFPFVQDGTAVA